MPGSALGPAAGGRERVRVAGEPEPSCGYGRDGNPSWEVLEQALGAIEGAEADAVIAAARLIVSATSFGGVQSSWERRARWQSETAPSSLIRLSADIELADDLIASIAHALSA